MTARNTVTIRTRYLNATDTRGSRISVTWEGRRRVVPVDYAASDVYRVAVETVFKLGTLVSTTHPDGDADVHHYPDASTLAQHYVGEGRGYEFTLTLPPLPRTVAEQLQLTRQTAPVTAVPLGTVIMVDDRPAWYYGYAPAGDALDAPYELSLQARDSDGWGWDFTFIVPRDYVATIALAVDVKGGSLGSPCDQCPAVDGRPHEDHSA